MHKKIRMLVKLLVVLALLVITVAGGAKGDAAGRSARIERRGEREFDRFPLWKDVPVRAFASLGEGKVHGTRWAVYIFRGAAKREGGKRPCIDVAHISADGIYGYSIECGPLAPAQGLDVPPVLALTSGSHRNKAGAPVLGETFLGMTFASRVKEVRLDLNSGKSITRETSYLSARQSKKAHLVRFRYIVAGLALDACIRHITGVDGQGQTVIDADTEECSTTGKSFLDQGFRRIPARGRL